MPPLIRQPIFWLSVTAIWLTVLCGLSSSSPSGISIPPIAHLDKIAHFGYFFVGAILLSAYLFSRNPKNPPWRVIIPSVIIAIACIGALDEFHQSFTPGRNGNDPLDWLADVAGGTTGALTFMALLRRLLPL